MRSGVGAIGVAVFLVAAGLLGIAAFEIGRDAMEIIRAVAPFETSSSQDAALALRACGSSARCREVLLQRVSEDLRAHEAGLRATVALLGCWITCALLLRRRMPPTRSPAGGARYARSDELRRLRADIDGSWLPLGYLTPPALVRPFFKFPVIRAIYRAITGPQVRLPAEDLARHMLVVGLTGSHKTTAVTFPVLLEAAHQGVSVVALDLKYGEADSLARTATEWQRCSRDVLTFAPLDPGSLRWNPLDRCRTMGDFYQFAAELFDEADSSDLDLVYWLGAERHVCAVLCFALATDGGHATLGRLRSLCESGPDAVEAYVRRHRGSPDLASRLGAYAAMLRKDQAGILQGVAARLEAWADEAVCAATEPSAPWEGIDVGRVRREPLLLVVGIPQNALGRLRWLCRLFLRHLASTLLRPRSADEQTRVLLVLEELPAWGALPGLADQLATFRSRQVSVLATLQSEAQGEHVYGRSGWAAVAANLVTKLYLPALTDFDAERLSRWLGTSVGEDVAWSRGWGSAGIRRGEHRRAVSVPLARPEALRGGGGPDEILVRFAHLPPAWLWCPAYYLRPEYHDRIPESRITTADLAVYHHLWTVHGRPGVPTSRDTEAAAGGRSRVAAPQDPGRAESPKPVPEPAPERSTTSSQRPAEAAPAAPAVDTVDDVRRLNQVMETLVLRARHDADLAVRVVHNRGRLVEVRVRPDVMLEVCRGADAMHALARRWSALRWVRRVRPSFVLSRRALDMLDPRLRATLSEAHGLESPAGPSPAGRGGS
jgi:type IV secretory pathway TraG/TraD family ATPase VirD4